MTYKKLLPMLLVFGVAFGLLAEHSRNKPVEKPLPRVFTGLETQEVNIEEKSRIVKKESSVSSPTSSAISSPVSSIVSKVITIKNFTKPILKEITSDASEIKILEKELKKIHNSKIQGKLYLKIEKFENTSKTLEAAYYTIAPHYLHINFASGKMVLTKKPVQRIYQKIKGDVSHSFYRSICNYGIPKHIANDCVNGLNHCVNFKSALRKGSYFQVLYSGIKLPNNLIYAPKVCYASVGVGQKKYEVYYYQGAKSEHGYYNAFGEMLKQNGFAKPLVGTYRISSGFGMRLDPFTRCRAFHSGIDYPARTGTPVQAAATGVVTMACYQGGYGRVVEINHGHGYATRYAHLCSMNVKVGMHVVKGKVIGGVGASGRATSAHLHFEVRHHGQAINPCKMISLPNRLAGKELTQFKHYKAIIDQQMRSANHQVI